MQAARHFAGPLSQSRHNAARNWLMPGQAFDFQGFPGIVYMNGGGILSAAGIVNDALLRIRLKTVEIELFEAEFDVDLFALG